MEPQGDTGILTTGPSRADASCHSAEAGTGLVVDLIEDGLLSIVLPENLQFTAAHTKIVSDELRAAGGGKPYGLLLHLGGVASIDRKAINGHGKAGTVTALALVGHTPVDRVMANRILAITSTHLPTGYFTDPNEALAWLRSYRSQDPNAVR
jgi:hypothetical protein